MAGIGMTSWSDVVNALEQDFSGIGLPSFSDVFLGEKVPRFIVPQVNANKSVDLIVDWKRRISPNSLRIDVAVVSDILGE